MPSSVPESVLENGKYGFARLLGAQAAPYIDKLAGEKIPPGIDLAAHDLYLTLQRDGEWRSLTLSATAGQELLNGLLESVILK